MSGYCAWNAGSAGMGRAAAEAVGLPYLPGAMTPSEVLFAIEKGYRSLKLFPANGSTSVKMLKSFKGPFTGIRFCPTGGVTPGNAAEFLSLPNVACVGGSWLVPADALAQCDWARIESLARATSQWVR